MEKISGSEFTKMAKTAGFTESQADFLFVMLALITGNFNFKDLKILFYGEREKER